MKNIESRRMFISFILIFSVMTGCLSGCGREDSRTSDSDTAVGQESMQENLQDSLNREKAEDAEAAAGEDSDADGGSFDGMKVNGTETDEAEAFVRMPAVELLHPVLASKELYLAKPDQSEKCSITEWDTVQLSDEEAQKYPRLAEALVKYSKAQDDAAWEQHQACIHQVSGYLGSLEEELKADGMYTDYWYEDLEEWPYDLNFAYQKHLVPIRTDEIAFTVREEYYDYMGGAYEWFTLSGVGFDTETGRELTVEDVITDLTRLNGILYEKLMAEYGDEFDEEIVKTDLESRASGEYEYNWLLSQVGVTFFFNSYDLNPDEYINADEGYMLEIDICFLEFPDLFAAKYASAPTEYVRHTGKNGDIREDIDGDGQIEKINVRVIEQNTEYSEEIDKGDSCISITVNNETETFAQPDGYDGDSWFVHTDSGNYIYFAAKIADYQNVMYFDLSDGYVRQIHRKSDFEQYCLDTKWDGSDLPYAMNEGSTERYYEAFTDTKHFYMETENGKQLFHVGEDGLPDSDL